MNYLMEAGPSSALGAIRDFISLVNSGKEKISKYTPNQNGPYLKGSLTEYSKDLVMTFPTMCDNSIPVETASMISRANERHMITLLQLLFASEQLHGTGGVDVLKGIHKNIKSNMSIDDYIDTVDSLADTLSTMSEAALNREIGRAERTMTQSLRNYHPKSYPVSSFSELSLNDYSILTIRGRQIVKEDPVPPIDPDNITSYDPNVISNFTTPALDDYFRDGSISPDEYAKMIADQRRVFMQVAQHNLKGEELKNAMFQFDQQMMNKKDEFEKNYAQRDQQFRSKQNMDAHQFRQQMKFKDKEYKQRLDQAKKDYELAMKRYKAQIDQDKFNRDLAQRKFNYQNQQDFIKQQQMQQQMDTEMITKRLLDTDIKKCNEMSPSLMVVKYTTVTTAPDGSNLAIEKPFVAGVKSRLISVDSMDIVDRLISKDKTKVSFLNFIRATTGEISFIKDFVLSLDQAKIDSKNAVRKGPAASMWKTLEFRSSKNQRRKLLRKGNDASAITTLVINQETVNFMRKQYEFDIENIRNTRMIMDAYNLMGIIICDESLEVAKIYYAGNDTFEQQAYSYLEKEQNDKSYKKVISLIGQMNGR